MGEPAGSTLREGLTARHHREEDASLEEGGPRGATGSPEQSPKVTPPKKGPRVSGAASLYPETQSQSSLEARKTHVTRQERLLWKRSPQCSVPAEEAPSPWGHLTGSGDQPTQKAPHTDLPLRTAAVFREGGTGVYSEVEAFRSKQ